ncbi:MAG: hypothetical protein CMP10_13335, partial [Zetaproteobacteria bacterium]|nr:hypothetical protein [Pseudobdellovibrionaceae bacterium]
MLKTMMITIVVLFGSSAPVHARRAVDYVDPFIGTGGHGHTHPSAVAPFGMIQAGPDTRISGWDSASGYYFGDPTIIGFTHTHLSGTGAIDRLDVLLMPTVGEAQFERGSELAPKTGYRSAYQREVATPGFYAVQLTDDQIDVRIAAATRSAIHEYQFDASVIGERRLLIDLQHRDDANVAESWIKVLSPTKVVGFRNTFNWARNQMVYFCMEFSEPLVDHENKTGPISDQEIKSSLNFGERIAQLKVKIGISAVDTDGACRNLSSEIAGWDLEQVRTKTENEWQTWLGRVAIEDPNEDRKRIYYTGLYHTLLAPNIYMDVDGRYRGMDYKVRQGSLEQPYYTIYSLWDTYRALHPFLNLYAPETNGKMIQALLKKYEAFGRLPEWELENYDTRIMIGYHGASVIADAYVKGVRNFDAKLALEAVLGAATEDKKELRDY